MQMRIFWLRMLLAMVLLPLLGGCKSNLSGPTKVGSSNHVEFQGEGKVGLAGDATVALYKQGTVGVVVGWEHFFRPVDDFSMRIQNHIYRGAVKFNVDLLSESPAKTVTKATLNYTIKNGVRPLNKRFPELCALNLLLAKDEWHGMPEVEIAKAPDTISGDPYKINLPEKPMGSVISIDVTDVVKAWATGTKTNFGFVFASYTEEKGLIKNNDKCWTLLSEFTLRVHYSTS